MHPKVQEYLNYLPTNDRTQFEKLDITFGDDDWPEGWYSDPHISVNLPIVQNLTWSGAKNNRATKFHIWYDRFNDVHKIEFTLDGERYTIEWYKVFKLTRHSDGKVIRGGLRHQITDIITQSRDLPNHRYWSST